MSDKPAGPSPRPRRTLDNALVAGLAIQVGQMNRNLETIAAQLTTKPSRDEVAYRRRSTVLIILLLLFGSVMLVDQHTEVCGPGHRAEVLIDAIARGEIHNSADFKRVAEHAKPSWVCGITFPFHTHDRTDWPQQQHVAGLVLYAAAFVALGVWTWLPYRATRNEPDPHLFVEVSTDLEAQAQAEAEADLDEPPQKGNP